MEINIFELELKPIVVGIPIKRFASGRFEIMTQKRYVKKKYRAVYDPVNHHRDEGIAGLLHPGEDVITGLLREFEEECGMPPGWKPLKILGVNAADLADDNRKIMALTSEKDYLQAAAIFGLPVGPDLKEWSNGRGDCTVRWEPDRLPLVGEHFYKYEPLCVVWNLGQPQHWLGPVFVVVVPPRWQPKYRKGDGEAGPHRWWPPAQLLETLQEAPDIFMGPEIPAFELLCEKILAGKLFK